MKNLNNQVQLIGRIGNALEIKETKTGKKFLNLSIATNEFYKTQDGERKQDTTWHKVIAWNKPAELMYNLLAKGNEIMIQGKLSSRSYDDKKGEKQYITEVVVGNFLKLDKNTKSDLPF